MSNDTTANTTTTNATTEKPKRKRAESTTVSALAVKRAKQRNIDVSRAAKDVRGRLRANFSALEKAAPKLYGPKGSVKQSANDGNRWGAIPASVADTLFKK